VEIPFKRIAVTRPPADWFHGILRTMFEAYRQAFVDLGLTVFEVPVDFFHVPDVSRISALLSDLRAFQPDVAFGLSHGMYALMCRMAPGRDGWRPNLFTEVLDIPTICCWDHTPLDLAEQVLHPPPKSAGESAAGAMANLRRALTDPRLIHWSRDRGQTRIMEELGLLRADRVIHEPSPSLPGFSTSEAPAAPGVGFVGHFYRGEDPSPEYARVTRATIEAWLGADGEALWDVLMKQIAGMDVEQRRSLALDPDQTMFWRYGHGLIVHRAQAAVRLKVLGGAGIPVACYGDFPSGQEEIPDNLVRMPGHIPFGPALAAALRRHEITIDVMNPAFVSGYSHKPVLGFASGGFLLIDRKQDFLDHFGAAGQAVSYEGPDDLAAKVALFLGKPGFRREVGDAIREEIATRFQLKDVLFRVLEGAAQRMETSGRRLPEDRAVIRVRDLLMGIRAETDWNGSRVEFTERGVLVTTSPQMWMFGAAIGLPSEVRTLREPHVRVTILVEEGRIGVAAMRDEKWELLAEQWVSPAMEAITVTVELPRAGVSHVILRNTVEGVSRAWVLGATLCDRA
jgi:hypothetical protein